MKIVQFNLLDNGLKMKALMRYGTFLFKRLTHKHRIYLFQLEGFYVEVVYDKSTCEIDWIDSFESTAMLSEYLDLIDISHLTEA